MKNLNEQLEYEDLDIEPQQLEDPYIQKLRNEILVKENKHRFQNDIDNKHSLYGKANISNTNATSTYQNTKTSRFSSNNLFGKMNNKNTKKEVFMGDSKPISVKVKDYTPNVSLLI